MATSVVERLVSHIDSRPGSFYRLWRKTGKTPAAMVGELRDVADSYAEDIEEDHIDFAEFFMESLDGLDSNEIFELGSELLALKEKHGATYR